MDTKLKNRHELFMGLLLAYLAIITVVLASGWYGTVSVAGEMSLVAIAAAAAGAWIFPLVGSFQTGNEEIFKAPFEAAALIGLTVICYSQYGNLPWELHAQMVTGTTSRIIFVGMAASYWASGCLRHLSVMGLRAYMKERSLLVRYGKWIRMACRRGVKEAKSGIGKLYHSFEEIDFSERNNKVILKIVTVNFLILAAVCTLWVFGIFALLVYSVILFGILRKYFNDIRGKYASLLRITNRMAEGELDIEITEDLGIFNPFKTEMLKIQAGYQKAVEKEVQSQRMRTELVTNVSHDLKTPLTAIITYVDLLKEEKDEEKRKEYVGILDKKSLRLKALIEDLFESSKASSQNVTLQIVDVDVTNLFKQVKLELEERFKEAGLDFRCTYPEEKLICALDSQKTYRIFENLLINVSKYALTGTRVYVKIYTEAESQTAAIQIMNVSAEEITVKEADLTERFVRGDASRNTEGSGLGLAIAKSFTELQKGSFQIKVEGDLFKVEVRFRLKEYPAYENDAAVRENM